jgi:hypothetical protein
MVRLTIPPLLLLLLLEEDDDHKAIICRATSSGRQKHSSGRVYGYTTVDDVVVAAVAAVVEDVHDTAGGSTIIGRNGNSMCVLSQEETGIFVAACVGCKTTKKTNMNDWEYRIPTSMS